MKEHCPECKEVLQGNNSLSFPWTCKCGVWEPEAVVPFTGEYVIKSN